MTNEPLTVPYAMPEKIGSIQLSPGVSRSQVALFVYVVVSGLCVTVFLPLLQPFVFTEMLHVPRALQGRLAGNLLTAQQVAVLIFVGLAGSLCDHIGRKQVLVIGLLGYGACMAAYPLARNVSSLFVIQAIYGTLSCAMIVGTSSMISDYPLNLSRGKFVATMIVFQAAMSAVLVGLIGARAPSWLVAQGETELSAGRHVFWTLAAITLIAAIVAGCFLRNPPRGRESQRPVGSGRSVGFSIEDLKRVVAHGRLNPRFGLVMLMGFVIRSDYLVMLSFVSLWVVSAASEVGMPASDALKTAGLLMLIFKLATAGSQVAFGVIADRLDRAKLLVGALFFTGFALVSTFAIRDVFGLPMMLVVAWIGIAESALIVCGQAILGEEAPKDLRGSAVGIFYFTGTLGVVAMSLSAGFLFDRIGHAGPFVLVGLLNLAFGLLGVLLLVRRRSVHGTDGVSAVG